MALDPNIALGVRPLELANPLTQYGQIAQLQSAQNQNQLAQYQLGAAQRAEKSQNMLADAYAQSTDPATGKIDYNKLTSLVAGGGGGAQIPAIQKARFENESAGTKLLADKLALLPSAYKMADTPEAYLALHQSIHSDPVLGPWLNSTGATPEKGLATLQKAIQTGTFEDLRASSMQSVSQLLDSMKPMVAAAGSSVYDPKTKTFTQAPEKAKTTDLMANYEAAKAQGFSGSIFDYESRIKAAGRTAPTPSAPVAVIGPNGTPIYVSREKAMGMTPATGAANMKPLTEGQTIKLRTDVGKDYQNASTALSQIDDILASANSVKTAPGLSAATGYTGKYLPSFAEGAAAQAETRLANLRGKVTALGKAQASMGGAIGSIATQEWKVLADQIAVLDETKGTKPLLEQIALLEEQAKGAAERIRDKYEKTRGDDFDRFPQFRDLPAPKAVGAPNKPATGSIHDQADAILRGGK